jgi:adenylate cyclase
LEAHSVEWKLAAIFAADVEAYSRLMGQTKLAPSAALTAYGVIIDRLIGFRRRWIFNRVGQGILVELGSQWMRDAAAP